MTGAMAQIINLRQRRKQAKREREAAQAAENRLLHGRSKAERERDKKEAEHARRSLDQHRVEHKDEE